MKRYYPGYVFLPCFYVLVDQDDEQTIEVNGYGRLKELLFKILVYLFPHEKIHYSKEISLVKYEVNGRSILMREEEAKRIYQMSCFDNAMNKKEGKE